MSVASKFRMMGRLGYTAAHAARVVALGGWRGGARRELVQLSHHLGYTEGRPRLPTRPLSDALGGRTVPFRMLLPESATYQVTTFELATIGSLVAAYRPRALFEFGTLQGRTTLNMLANAPDDAVVHTIDLKPERDDLPDGLAIGAFLKEQAPDPERVVRLFGNTLEFDFAPYHGTQDFVFIDAGHDYRCASNDTAAALRMTEGRPGPSVIVWHDYHTIEGVTQAVDEAMRNPPPHTFLGRIAGTTVACLVRQGG